MSRAAPGSSARRSTRRAAIFGRALRSITRIGPFISSSTCASSTNRLCASSATRCVRRRVRWRAPMPGVGGSMARPLRGGSPINRDDFTGFSLILIVVGLCILGWAGWQVWHAQISRFALLVAHYEMQAIGVVTDRFQPADIAVQHAHAERVQFGQLGRLYRNIGQELVYPAIVLVLALAGSCFLPAGNAPFPRTFDLEKLMPDQAIHSRSTAASV